MEPPKPTPLAVPSFVVLVVVTVLLVACSRSDDVADDGGRGGEAGGTVAGATATTATTGTTVPASSSMSSSTASSTAATTGLGGSDGVVEYVVKVVNRHPHDTGAYTQGLEAVDDLLLESTGIRGESTLRLVEPTTGEQVRSVPLDDELFAEGATVIGDEVWQLTWTSGIAFVYDLDDFGQRRQFSYQGEGWGLCATGDRLVMSDGSSTLTLRDPVTFEVLDQVQVLDDGAPLARLNELECVDGLVWANVYQTTRIVAVDPTSGQVVGTLDIASLVPEGFEGDTTNVANGIAHDPATGRFWLTGKRWPVLYEVELVPLA